MARPARTTTDLVLVSSIAAADVTDLASARLDAALADQEVAAAFPVRLVEPDPARRRERLAELVAGPPDPTAPSDPAASLPAIALVAGDLVTNAPPLGAVLDDERLGTAALARLEEGRAVHLGVLRVAPADRPRAAALLRSGSIAEDDVILGLSRALGDAGVTVRPVPLGGYAWARPADADEAARARAAADAVPERTVRLREAARGGDGFYSTFVLRRLSWRLTGLAERAGLTPNQVTSISFGLGLLAAGLLALGGRGWSVAGALLLQLCLVVDCVDGELARYRRRFSRFGAWLDATTDRVKEFAAIAALAVAAHRHDGTDLWGLVAAAIAVQTFRNLFDLGWAQQRASTPGPAPQAPRWVAPAERWWAPTPDRPRAGALNWARRVGHFPVGERFLLLSLGAALWTPRATLLLLLAAGLLSALYMLAAFALRSRGGTGDTFSLLDSGPLLGAVLAGRGAGRPGAVLPAVLAAAELGLIWWLAAEVAGAGGGPTTLLLAAAALAHYQHAYGVREKSADAGGFVVGTDLRLAALALVVVVPASVLTGPDATSWARSTVLALAALVLVSSTTRSLLGWTRGAGEGHSRQATSSPGEEIPGETAPGTPGVSAAERPGPETIDRMDTVNAGTDGTVLRPTTGGER
jgi:Family of unknown function (DUF5941)/CDP-alcohol phosphatidyltransferase